VTNGWICNELQKIRQRAGVESLADTSLFLYFLVFKKRNKRK
jgi:hypothetical protein